MQNFPSGLQIPSSVVTLLLAPAARQQLDVLPPQSAVWIASSSHMHATLACARALELEVTELFPRGDTCEEWLFNHLDSLDQHHNDYSQQPGYSTLLVYGVTHTPAIALFLEQFGFVASKSEPFGFSATKY
jgi:hypothetical protein